MQRMAVQTAWLGLVCGAAAVSCLRAHSDVLPLQRLNSVPNGPVLVVLPLGEFQMGAALARTADDQPPITLRDIAPPRMPPARKAGS